MPFSKCTQGNYLQVFVLHALLDCWHVRRLLGFCVAACTCSNFFAGLRLFHTDAMRWCDASKRLTGKKIDCDLIYITMMCSHCTRYRIASVWKGLNLCIESAFFTCQSIMHEPHGCYKDVAITVLAWPGCLVHHGSDSTRLCSRSALVFCLLSSAHDLRCPV